MTLGILPKSGTSPWGLANAFNDLNEQLVAAGGPDLGTAEYSNYGTKADLIDNVKQGNYTTIMFVWGRGAPVKAHFVDVVGYDADTDQFLILDPGTDYSADQPEDRVQRMSWSQLEADWSRPMVGLQNVMITYRPAQP